MRTNYWVWGGLVCVAAATLSAQEAKPSAASREAASALAKDVVLQPPATATVKQESINVRGLPAFAGELITHLKKGQTVSVLEQITLAKPKAGEPAAWSRITLPADAPVYVFADYIDTNTMTVSARPFINVRGGPSENFSVVAHLEKGAPVKEVRRTQNWIQIEPPTNSYGFVATEYLVLQAPAPPPPALAVVPEPVAPPPAAVPEPVAPPPAAAVTNAPAEVTNTPPPTAVVAPEPVAPPPMAAPTNTPTPAATVAPVPEPIKSDPDQRIVTREGRVRKTKNVQAPADYELHDIQTDELTEYLFSTDPKFKVYNGARVTVTGPEMMDRRWPKTPVLQVETIFLMP